MRTNIPEKLLNIADEIDTEGYANLTRLTVLKKWFERPERLRAFAVWVAGRATSRKGKTAGEAGGLFKEARGLLVNVNKYDPQLDREAAQALYYRLRAFQNEHKAQSCGPVRIIKNWNLLLVEEGLRIYLGLGDATPSAGYKLAADYCQNDDPRFGTNLNGPSRTKIEEIVRFMFTMEALEDGKEEEE
jgi:hypothetical protein